MFLEFSRPDNTGHVTKPFSHLPFPWSAEECSSGRCARCCVHSSVGASVEMFAPFLSELVALWSPNKIKLTESNLSGLF